jgi:phenylalanyl-tRNA synthetase beta chain
MRVSLNLVKRYVDFELPRIDELVARINQRLGGVETTIDLAERYKDVVIAKVVACEKHPNADKLNLCRIDDGRKVADVERDTDGFVQVVCGAPNVRADMVVAWLPPKSIVPSSATDDEPFVLGSRELRGILSHGMLASPKELGLGDSHDGILEINPDEWKPSDIKIEPGASFAQAYGLDDTIIDIENKMFTHRPDLFGQIGVAREIAGIHHERFKSPDWYATPSVSKAHKTSDTTLPLAVVNDASSSVPRFMAVVLRDIEVKPSPVWLQAELVRLGGKPINNIVDVTNYVMLLTAQPTHAYDYDKLRGAMLGTRMAKQGEKITLLNHKTYQLDQTDIVIVDGEGPVGLAGIMGGGDSEVSANTKNIVLEVANFDMYTVRRSSMKHGLFTDALTRFTKGQSARQNDAVLQLLMSSIRDVASGVQASAIFDEGQNATIPSAVTTSVTFINQRLGLQLRADEMAELLRNVEITVETKGDEISVLSPFWRTDLELPEDVVEEVGRLYGFDRLPRELPLRSIAPAHQNPIRARRQAVRERLSMAGANEILTYSFVHKNILEKAGQDTKHAFTLSNALSPDLQYYRLTLTPSLLDKVHMNIKAGYPQFALFELGKSHFAHEMDADEPDVPNEDEHVGLVVAYADKQTPTGAAYYQARRYLGEIIDLTSIELTPLKDTDIAADKWGKQLVAAYEPARAAVILKDKHVWGVVGEFKQSVSKAFKLPAYAAGFEVHADVLTDMNHPYQPLSRFPSVTQDVSIQVTGATSFAALLRCAEAAIDEARGDLLVETSPVSIYQPEADGPKTITLRLNVASYEKTLTDSEVRPLVDAIGEAAKDSLKASVV